MASGDGILVDALVEEEGESGADGRERNEHPEHRFHAVSASADDDVGKHGAGANSGVEHSGSGVVTHSSPVGGKSERDTNEKVHNPVLVSEFGLALGVHEDDSRDSEGAHDFDENRAEPLIILHDGTEILIIVGEPKEDASNEGTDQLE